jgi:ankyrin repeat protein
MIKESSYYLVLSIILQFFSASVYAKNNLDSCIHLTSLFGDSLFYDKAKVVGGNEPKTQIQFPHPKICQSYDFKCKTREIKPNELVSIGNVCGDSVFIKVVDRTLIENGYKTDIKGWIDKEKLKFINETDLERLKRKKRKFERANKSNSLIYKRYFQSDAVSIHDTDFESVTLEEIFEAMEYAILRNDTGFIRELSNDKRLFSEPKHCSLLFRATYADPEILELLINKGLNANCLDKYGGTPLMSAAATNVAKGRVLEWHRIGNSYNLKPNPIKAAKLLIKNGAKVNRESNINKASSALNYAIANNAVDMVAFLIDKGADVNNYVIKKTQKAPTSLMYAINQYSLYLDPTVIDLLLSNGADINYKSKLGYNYICNNSTPGRCPYDGQTALTLSVQDNYYPVVKLLLEAGADPLLCRRSKREDACPIDIAKKNNNKKIEELILTYIK